MKTYTQDELNEILRLHKLWLENKPKGIRADLSEANLSEADLSRADLSRADLSEANLSEANLFRADLSEANLFRANLSEANLFRANLFRANLSEANLFRADLSRANLSEANLFRADLSEANLSRANLSEANLSEANLSEADLSRADLSRANLSKIKNFPSIFIVPEKGSFIGYKKCTTIDKKNVILELEIPKDAKRINSTGRKCRASKIKVLKIFNLNGKKSKYKIAYGLYNKLIYEVGNIIKADSFNDDIREECTNGIHFFITKKEAEEY